MASSVPCGKPSILRNAGSFSFSASSLVKCSRRACSLGNVWPRHSTGPESFCVVLIRLVILFLVALGLDCLVRRLLGHVAQFIDGFSDLLQLLCDRMVRNAGTHIGPQIHFGLFAVLVLPIF